MLLMLILFVTCAILSGLSAGLAWLLADSLRSGLLVAIPDRQPRHHNLIALSVAFGIVAFGFLVGLLVAIVHKLN